MDCGLDGLTFTEPSHTKPDFAPECELKNIVNRFLRTGQLPAQRPPVGNVDVTNAPDDFMELQNAVAKTVQTYEQLPQSVRDKFPTVDSWLDAQAKAFAERQNSGVDDAAKAFAERQNSGVDDAAKVGTAADGESVGEKGPSPAATPA